MGARKRPRHGLVFIHPSDELYGADRILLDLVSALSADELRDAEFWLPTDLAHGPDPLCEQLRARGATVRHVDLPVLRRALATPSGLMSLLRRCGKLWRLLLDRRPEEVYCTTSATLLSAPIARLSGVPRVVGHLQELWNRLDRAVLSLCALACHRLVAISEPVRAQLPSFLTDRCVVVINSTLPPEVIEPLDGRHGELRFVVASRWNAWKGHRTLLEAWDRLEQPGLLTILGGPPQSGVSTDVIGLRDRLRRPETVRIVGEVADVGPFFSEADVVLVPSDTPEPFGLVAIEAFARGRPVVGSRGGGLADIVTDGYDGWLYPMGDSGALAALLGSMSRVSVTESGTRALTTYEERFTPERYRREWRLAAGLSRSKAEGR